MSSASGRSQGYLSRFLARPRKWTGARGRTCGLVIWSGFAVGMAACGMALGFLPGRNTGASPPVGGTTPTWVLNGSLELGVAALVLVGLGLAGAASADDEEAESPTRTPVTVLVCGVILLPFEAGAITAVWASRGLPDWFEPLLVAIFMPILGFGWLYGGRVVRRNRARHPGRPADWPRV